jgi:hypothetical protein
MLTTSKDANPNYLCKVVALKGLKKHGNADRLQTVDIDFQTVITGLDAKDGDVYVFFPVESKISADFLSATNSFRDKGLNSDKEKAGFFEDKCRVKAMKLRGEKSMGYIVPANIVVNWALGKPLTNNVYVPEEDYGTEFDTINGKLLVEKYQAPRKAGSIAKQGKKPKVSRLVEGQIHLHVDTENLRKNAHKINPEDIISITYKTHGTSWWVSNVLVKRNLSVTERVMKWLGFPVEEMEYDLVYGSRKVVKNADMDDPKRKDHFFGYDLWEKIKDEVGESIPKGYTLYGEMIGFDHNGGAIQKGFDYGCKPEGLNFCNKNVDSRVDPQHKLEVYRITQTNPDGLVTELSYPEIAEFCDRSGLTAPHLFYYGEARGWKSTNRKIAMLDEVGQYSFPVTDYQFIDIKKWREGFIQDLENQYNERDCFMCDNPVPEEGIVVRKESLFNCESYKLKSFRFLEWESKELDSGEADIESEN